MLIHIANWEDADRRSATADETLAQGNVCYVSGTAGGGVRKLRKVTQASELVDGNVAIVVKVSDNALAVTSSTGVPTDVGSNLVTIVSGDAVIAARKGSILEYDVSLLHASITASNVSPGEKLALLSGQWCKVGTGSSVSSPLAGVVYDTLNGKVRVELVI